MERKEARLAVLEAQHIGFQIAGSTKDRVLRSLVGILGVAVLFFGLGSILPEDPTILALPAGFFRFFIASFWVAYLAPWFFVRIGIATTKRVTEN